MQTVLQRTHIFGKCAIYCCGVTKKALPNESHPLTFEGTVCYSVHIFINFAVSEEREEEGMKKKVVALTTAFVMVMALVAAIVPATVSNAKEAQKINSLDITVTGFPAAGTVMTIDTWDSEEPTFAPTCTFTTDKGDVFKGDSEDPGYLIYAKSYARAGQEDFTELSQHDFPWTIENGDRYLCLFEFWPDSGYEFDENVQVNINGVDAYDIADMSSGRMVLWAQVTVGDASAPAQDQTVDEATPAATDNAAPATKTSKASATTAKTADPVPFVAVALVALGAGAVAVVVIRRRRSY